MISGSFKIPSPVNSPDVLERYSLSDCLITLFCNK